jgi:hypothetical protein
MGKRHCEDAASEDQISRLIAEYLDAEQTGAAPDRERLLQEHPDLAEELQAFFSDHDRMKGLVQSLRPTSCSPDDTLAEQSTLPSRLLNRNVPQDLEAICMKCLEKEPARRYGSASQVRDELERYLQGESIQASSVNVLDRMTRALRQAGTKNTFEDGGWGS